MKRVSIIAAFLFALCFPAAAQFNGCPPGFCNGSGASPNAPTVDLNLAAGTAAGCATISACLTATNASGGYCTDSAGLVHLVAANMPRICSGTGLLTEPAATNSALWARDMTQTAWVSVGMGTALNAIGADGLANLATTLTASGTAGSCTASCTSLQSITLGSASYVYSVYLKRVTGSGTVNLTENNLGAVTPCAINSLTFTRCAITTTLANPVIGIQMTVVGDIIIADFNQLESINRTSPFPTTTVAATRNTDVVVAAGALLTALTTSSGSMVFNAGGTNLTNAGRYFTATGPFSFPSSSSVITILYGGTGINATFGSGNSFGATILGASWSASSISLVANNGTLVNNGVGTGWAASAPYQIGSNGASSYLGTFSRIRTYNLLPDAVLKNIT